VREGEIRLRTQRAVERASAGDELTVNHEGNVARRAIVATDEAWSWSLGIAPPFDINGETLGAYLDWLARETHWEIRFADPSLESLRGETLGSTGSIDLPPDRAFADVLRSASLRGDLEGNVLMIRSAR
jgi:ferric-dicitrate binding protein FerR (iron transport regulator)